MKSATDRATEIRRSDFLNRDFLLQNMKDPSLVDEFMQQNLFKARRLAIILGVIMIVALLGVVYGFVQNQLTLEAKGEFFATNSQLMRCQEETKKQAGLAKEAAIIAEEVLQAANDELNECLKKK